MLGGEAANTNFQVFDPVRIGGMRQYDNYLMIQLNTTKYLYTLICMVGNVPEGSLWMGIV